MKKLALAGTVLGGSALTSLAQTDIPATTTAVSGYVTAAVTVGIAVLLFTLGRKVLRKLV